MDSHNRPSPQSCMVLARPDPQPRMGPLQQQPQHDAAQALLRQQQQQQQMGGWL